MPFPALASSSAMTRERRPGALALDGSPRRRQLWRVIDGAVAEAFRAHPEYFTRRGARMMWTAMVKRIVGSVMGYEAGRNAAPHVSPE